MLISFWPFSFSVFSKWTWRWGKW